MKSLPHAGHISTTLKNLPMAQLGPSMTWTYDSNGQKGKRSYPNATAFPTHLLHGSLLAVVSLQVSPTQLS